jgi:hypothetical protein
MTTNAATNAGIGGAALSTRLKLSISSIIEAVKFGGTAGALIPLVIWFWLASPESVDVAKIHIRAAVFSDSEPRQWRMRDESGVRKLITVKRTDGRSAILLTPDQVRSVIAPRSSDWTGFLWCLMLSPLAGVAGAFGVYYFLTWYGKSTQKRKRIRGVSDIATPEELSEIVRSSKPAPTYSVVDVALPASAPMTGILMLGSQGSGKSLAIHDLMQQVFRRGKKSIILDQSGEFFRAYYRPGKDFFFNPALEGSVAWSIFEELDFVYDADTLAQAFLPVKDAKGGGGGAGQFFEDAARSLFSVMLLRLRERGAVNTADLARAILEMPDEEMNKLVEKSVASSAIGGDSKAQRQGVIASIAIYLNGISAVKQGAWTMKEWLEKDDDSRFFLLNTRDTQAMFAPLYRLLLVVAYMQISAKAQIVHEDKYWFFLDEIFQFGDIRLDEILALARKFGVSVVAGVQARSQMESGLGQQRAQTVLNCFNTVLQLRANEPTMQELGSKMLGSQDEEVANRNVSLAVTAWRDGAGLQVTEKTRVLVMPSELGALANCVGYLKLAGDYPVARVDYRHWLTATWPLKPRVAANAPKVELPARDTTFKIVAFSTAAGAAAGAGAASTAAASTASAGGDQKLTPPRSQEPATDATDLRVSEVPAQGVDVSQLVDQLGLNSAQAVGDPALDALASKDLTASDGDANESRAGGEMDAADLLLAYGNPGTNVPAATGDLPGPGDNWADEYLTR